MASNVRDNQVPSREDVAEILQYLNILYPEGKPIDPAEHRNSIIPSYKNEVNRFMELIGQKWAVYEGCFSEKNDWS